ncbi:thioredoxin reductase 1, cytoplasmic-like [Lineus longissimus]|uniref:thioredoxin reductase 1, cytoplasmic-like n=1 Tax=Lineus longissimus TaxID=88925 RepID=UPI002B4D4355
MPPISGDPAALIQQETAVNHVVVFTLSDCAFSKKVKALLESLNVNFRAVDLDASVNGEGMQTALSTLTKQETAPYVFIGGKFIGDANSLLQLNADNKLIGLIEQNHADSAKYDYDLIVIGGGSGGLAASKEAADLGAKVALLDYVVPSPLGTTWGLGGTCVNVGCIPKKLMHTAAIMGHNLEDAKHFGWEYSEHVKHNWETMKDNIQSYIKSLNWGYRVQLRSRKVTYLNALGEMIGPHTVKTTNKKGVTTEVSSRFILIATGMRPRYPDIPGAKEYGVTSDDLFSLDYCPGKTLVIGASYVALECAGFLAGIGLDVTVMVRSILLRGFDQQMAGTIGDYMKNHNVKFIRPCVPTMIEQLEPGKPGRLRVTSKMQDSGDAVVGEYNTVLFGIGRDACTAGIGLEGVGVQLNPKNGKVIAKNEQSSIPHIYAIGDILDGKLELTPVAIQAGRLLAKRLFGGQTAQCDYRNVPTTVFTPLEYGCVGYSEEEAVAEFGAENLEVYHGNLWPLEWTVAHREESVCYVKLICVISEQERVIGLHVAGPNAGEITQGYALGIKMGATKADFDNLIGIHPTVAEVFTTMTVTKRSGADFKQAGC